MNLWMVSLIDGSTKKKEKNMQRYAKVFTKKVKGIESIGKYAK